MDLWNTVYESKGFKKRQKHITKKQQNKQTKEKIKLPSNKHNISPQVYKASSII